MVVLVIVGSMMNTARQIGQGVAIVGVVVVMVVGGRRVLTRGAGTVLARGARGAGAGAAAHHGAVHGLVLLGGVHEVTEQVVVRKVSLVNETLKVKGYFLSGQLGQFSVRLFSKMFQPERIRHVVGSVGVVVVVIDAVG